MRVVWQLGRAIQAVRLGIALRTAARASWDGLTLTRVRDALALVQARVDGPDSGVRSRPRRRAIERHTVRCVV